MANGFTNSGAIELTTAAGGSQAALNVTSGTLVNASSGTISALAGLGGGPRTLGLQLDNQGTVTIGIATTLALASAAHQNEAGGTINLSGGDLTVSQSGTSPSFTNAGMISVGATRTLTINSGAFNMNGGSLSGAGAWAVNSVTANFASPFTFSTAFVSGSSTLNGPGALTVASGQSMSLFNSTVNAALTNNGTVFVHGNAPSTQNGTFANAAGSMLRLSSDPSYPSGTLNVANGFTNSGAIELTNTVAGFPATLNVTSGTLVNAPTGTISVLAGLGGGARTLGLKLDNQGTVTIGIPTTLAFASASHQNEAGGTINLSGGDLTVTQSGTSPSFTNAGTISIAASQTLSFNTGTFTNVSAGTLSGFGTLAVSAPVAFSNAGTIAPGASPGVFHITGPCPMTSTSTLNVELGGTVAGTGYDQLAVTGAVTQNGTLNLSLVNGFVPTVGQSFSILTSPAATGSFGTVNAPSLGGGLSLVPSYSATGVTLTTTITPLAGTYVIGTGGDFATLAAASASLNSNGVSAPVTFQIKTGTYNESLVLNGISGVSSTNRVTFTSQSGVASDVIVQAASLSSTGTDSPIQLNGAQYIAFTNVTIQSSSSAGSSNGGLVWMLGNSPNDQFTGCIFNTVGASRAAVHTLNATVDNLQVVNCQFSLPATNSYGVMINNTGSAANVLVQNNLFTSGASAGNAPVYVVPATTGLQILGNTMTLSGLGTAVNIQGAASGAVLRGNRISGATTGMNLTAPGGGTLIANNMIQASTAPITVSGPTGMIVAFNSLSAGGNSAALTVNGATAGSVTLKNNVLACPVGAVPLFISNTGVLASPDYNDYYTTGGVVATIGGTDYASVAALQVATGFESHGVSANPGFVSTTDLHARAPAVNNAGTPLAAVLDDADGEVRSLSTPDIGADEFSTALTPLAGTYTVGASGTYATPAAAASDLCLRGVSAPVSFLIQSGTYTGTVLLTPVRGASAANRVRFVAQSGLATDAILQAPGLLGDGSDAAVRYEGTRYVDLDSLTLQTTTAGSSVSGGVAWVLYFSANDRFQGCRILENNTNCSGIRSTNATLDTLVVTNCQFSTGSSATSVLFVQIGSGGTANGAVLSGNSFTGVTSSVTGLLCSAVSTGASVLNNTFAVGGTAISLNATATSGCIIRGNRISGGTGLNASSLGASSLIANNFIQATVAPVTLSAPLNLTIAFNSLLASGVTNALTINGGTAAGTTLRNNIFACPAASQPVSVAAGVIGSADYDDYYTTGATLATIGVTPYATLAALQTAGFEAHGVLANPGFVSSTDLHARAPTLDNAGTPLGLVLDDVDGQVRSLTTPDIGADEFSAPAPPMAGVYTVGASGAYPTPTAAAADVSVRGISAPVSFLIQSGTYTGTSVLTPIAGASTLTRVRFAAQSGVAGDVILQATGLASNGSDAVIRHEGGSYIDVDTLTIQPTAAGSGSLGADVMTFYECIGDRFQGCVFNVPSSGTEGIRVSSGAADNLQVSGCLFNITGASALGLYLSSATACTGVSILNNTITATIANNFGISSVQPTTGLVVQGNTITMIGGTGISLAGSSQVGMTARGNKISGGGAGMNISVASGGSLIANNMIQSSGVALNLANPTGAMVAFNTLESTGTGAVFSNSTGAAGGLTLKNNILASVGGGPLLLVQVGTLGAADYNDYYTTGTVAATVGSTSYATLSAFQSATGFEAHGILGNPGFVSATDLHSSAPAINNAGTPLGAVLDDIDGEVRSLTVPDIGADEFSTSLTPMAGTYVVGASGAYATPAAAAAVVEVRGVSGPVTFAIQPGTYDGTTVLTPITGANPVNRVQFTSQTGVPADVVLQAATNLSDGSDAVILINGARYADVTNVTLRSTGVPSNPPGGLVWMLGGCIGDHLQGCTLNTVSTYRVGIRSQGATIDSSQFINNQLTVAGTASYGIEITIPGTANGTVFSGNTVSVLGASVEAFYMNIPATGLVLQNQFITFSGGGSGNAFSVSGSITNAVIRGNRVYGATNGMNFQSLGNALIANNMIQGTGYPLQLASPTNVTVAFNSLNATSSLPAFFVQASGSSSMTLENNIFACSGTPRAMQILGAPPSVLTVSDANDLFTTGPTLAAINGVDYPTLAALRTATGQDVHTVNVNPAYVSSTDLHTAAPGLDGKALPLASVLDDYDGQLRNVTTPDIGADEFTIGVTDVTPPNTSIVSGPPDGGWLSSGSTVIGWSGADDISLPATLRFKYSMDGAPYSTPAYATSNSFTGLSEGSHTIAVAAIDEVGNVDPTPATRTFTVDVTAPDTQILTGPAENSTVSAANAVFTISGSDNLTPPAQVGFLYTIDGGGLNAIGTVTTISLTSLANGPHTLQVYAQDLAGNMDASPAARHFTVATVYDLTADWSDTANPNGPWRYNEGTNLLPHVSAWTGTTGDFSTAQPAWARSASGTTIIPAIFKSSATVVPVHDWQSGDVIMHTTDPSFGVGGGPGNITWTSPVAATISISGGVWMGREIVRSNHWALYLNGTLLTQGDVASPDPYSRSAPFNFAAGTGGAGAISSLVVGAGDVVKLELTKNSISGDYTGIQMQIQSVATNGTPPKPVILAGPAASGWSGASTAFTWTLGAHSEPASTVRYATRLDAGTTSAFLVDTTLSLAGLAEGSHTLWIIARDDLAMRDSTSRIWTVDVTAPTVAFASGPIEAGYSTTAPTFGWSGTDNLAPANQLRFAYSLDGGAFTAPATATIAALSGLASGAHTLAVHSVDLAGNPSANVTRHWTVDGTAPETQIVSGPANASTIGANSTTFGFTGTDDLTPTGSLSYQSRLDGGAWSATAGSTIATLSNLADGPHTFDVRAVDLGGNIDATPATRSFTVDALGPVVTIVTGPAASACLNTTSAAFSWSATDAVTPQGQIVFAWQLDGGVATAFDPTTSTTLSALGEGQHTFTIQSRDGSGHVTSLARTFQVDVTTPFVNAPTTRVLDSSKLRVQCSATDVGGVTGYRVQVSTDPAFGSVAADVSIGSTGLYDFTGTPGATYYARAQASDCAGNTTAFSGPSNPAVLANLPNLVVSAVTGPPSATGGLSAQVSFTVSNTGVGPTSAPSWNDYVYLSPTSTFSAGTAVLEVTKPNLSVLAPGESYVSTATVNLPIGTSGNWYLIVKADGADAQPETDGTDNLRASSAIAVALGAFADLHVTTVVAPPTALSSDVVTVNWTVKNDGTGRTNATDWWDTILLSSDTNFDFTVLGGGLIRCIDLPLAQVHHVGALDPGASYSGSAQVQLPGSFGGDRYVLVAGDLNATSVNQAVPQQGNVFENQLDMNIGVSNLMVVTQEQPSDLTVDAVSAPTSGSSGGSVAVSFTVGNHGFNATPAYSSWTDKVWFSTDNALDANDVLMGTFAHTGTSGAGIDLHQRRRTSPFRRASPAPTS